MGIVLIHVDTPDPSTFDRKAFLAIMDTCTLCLGEPFILPDMPQFGIVGRTMGGEFVLDEAKMRADCKLEAAHA